jgi:putative membrane protein
MYRSLLVRALPVLFAGTLLAPLPAVAQSQAEPQQKQGMKQEKMSEKQKDRVKSEQAFMTEAAMGNLTETQLGQLALDRSENDKVKELGQALLDDHSKAEETVKQYLESAQIREPNRVSEKDTKVFTKLTQTSRDKFDMEFVNAVIKNHEKDVKTYEKWQSKAQDPAVKSYIDETLPVLQKHLKMAQDIKPTLQSGKTS